MYHSIGRNLPGSVSTSEFRFQMSILNENFKVLPLRQFHSDFNQTSEPLAAVTFDDGLRDNFEHAYPVLESMGLKGTFFITTGYIGEDFTPRNGHPPMMNEQQIQELSRYGHEIGAHSVSHPDLKNLSEKELNEEVTHSQNTLAELVEGPVTSFAYPSGHYSQNVVECLEKSGFERAVTTKQGQLVSIDNEYTLPRLAISNTLNRSAFRAKISPAEVRYIRLWEMCFGERDDG